MVETKKFSIGLHLKEDNKVLEYIELSGDEGLSEALKRVLPKLVEQYHAKDVEVSLYYDGDYLASVEGKFYVCKTVTEMLEEEVSQK